MLPDNWQTVIGRCRYCADFQPPGIYPADMPHSLHEPLPGTNIRKRATNARQAQLAMERKNVQVQPAKQPMIPIPTDSRELREMFTAEKLLKHGPMFNYVPRRS
eukprot:g52350.t1